MRYSVTYKKHRNDNHGGSILCCAIISTRRRGTIPIKTLITVPVWKFEAVDGENMGHTELIQTMQSGLGIEKRVRYYFGLFSNWSYYKNKISSS